MPASALATVTALNFSRLEPKGSPFARPLRPTDRPFLMDALTRLWGDHALFDAESAVSVPGWWVLDRDGIRAAVWTRPRSWVMTRLPGAGGFLLKNLLSRLPYLGRVLSWPRFDFVHFQGGWCQPGREPELLTLMEAVLARHQRYIGIGYLDPESPLFQRLDALGRLGMLDRLVDRPRARIMTGHANLTGDQYADLER